MNETGSISPHENGRGPGEKSEPEALSGAMTTAGNAIAEPIAIVGMACRFPGAKNLSEFWNLLVTGAYHVSEVPADRWDINAFYDPDPSAPGKVISRFGGFLPDLEKFDAFFFGISPREAPHVDPRQRLMLEVAWEALEDAGIPPTSLSGSKTGVFLSTLTNDYDQILNMEPALLEVHSGPGTADSIVANRISYVLNFRGPSLSLDTACSGSLIAIDLACKSLSCGESTLALAGGVAVNLLPTGDIFFSKAGSLSPDGRCRTFDAGANGIVRSEGAGLIVLRRLSDAVANGDRIYAVVRGCGVNHDGRTNGITAPNPDAQQACLEEAYRRAGVSPGKVQYVEAHGTGTVLGDPVEVTAIAAALGEGRAPGFPCVIGSVKTNIGHTESAAGVAGVIKTALALKHRLIPPNLHLKEINPKFPATDFPIRVCQKPSPWPAPAERLIAGVSSFGFGGANSHVVLEEFVQEQPRQVESSALAHVLPLSARTSGALAELANSYLEFLDGPGSDVSLNDLCYGASVGRSHLEYRLALTARSKDEVRDGLNAFLQKTELPPGISFNTEPSDDTPKLVFVFSGQGVHRPHMGLELWKSEPVFRTTVDKCDKLIREHLDWSVVDQINSVSPAEVDKVEILQLTAFVFQVALADLWRSWGVRPAAIVGQSLGEVAAAYAAGALSLEDAVQVVYHRSRLLNTAVGKGQTAVVGAPVEQVNVFLEGIGGAIAVAGNTGPLSSVISGENSAIEEIGEYLKGKNIFFRPFVAAAAHSPQMEPLVPELIQSISGITPNPSSIPFLSTVTVERVDGEKLGPDYWGRNLREPFRLWDVLRLLINDGYDTFLEISCHPAVVGSIRQGLAHLGRTGVALPSLEKDKEEQFSLLSSLGALYSKGYQVDWRLLFPDGARVVTLPSYPWQRERYWVEDLRRGKASQQGKKSGQHPLLGEPLRSALTSGERYWEMDLGVNTIHYLKGHRIANTAVFPAAGYIEMALAAGRQMRPDMHSVVEEASFDRALILPSEAVRRLQFVVSPSGSSQAQFQVFSAGTAPEENDAWTLHASGKIRWERAGEAGSPSESADEIKIRCTETVSAEQHYCAMQGRGIDYGPAFQAVAQVWRRDGEALSRLEIASNLQSEAKAYQIHPVLLDAAFQTVSGTLPSVEGDSYLPRSIKRLKVFTQPEGTLWCNARLAPGVSAGDDSLNADLLLFDDSGRVVASVEGLELQRLDKAHGAKAKAAKELTYDVRWRPATLESSRASQSLEPRGFWLILADTGGLGEALAAHIEAAGDTCVLAHPVEAGGQYRVSENKREFWINSERPEDVTRLLSDVGSSDVECRGVVHLWGLDAVRDSEATVDDLRLDQSLCCLTCASLIPALIATAGSRFPRIWLVTKGSRQIDGERVSDRVGQATLWGLGRVIAREHPEFWGGSIDLQEADAHEQMELVRDEILARDGEDQIAYRGGQRYVARLERAQSLAPSARGLQCRADGAYLITGGLTGIGLETAFWLARKGARRLILLSRTPLPPRSEWRGMKQTDPAAARVNGVLRLEAMGLSVHTAAVDIGDAQQITSFLDDYNAQGFPPIRGVFHSAGLIQDRLLLRADPATFEAVFQSKVYGAWLLHRITSDYDLDFFVMNSSLSSLFGQFGQANYAAGNAFIDALAHFRRDCGLPALAINWGPWSKVGIFAGLKGFEAEMMPGVGTISPEEGLTVLDYLMSGEGSPAQVAVMDADWTAVPDNRFVSDLISTQAGANGAEEPDSEGKLSMLALLIAEPEERASMLEAMFRDEAARVLRVEPSRINTSKPLTTLGLDSIMAVELKNRVEANLGMPLPLADLFTGSISRLAERMAVQIGSSEQLEQLLTEIEQLPDERNLDPGVSEATGSSHAATGSGGDD